MSAKYSTSPTLRLVIADSTRYRCCQWFLHLVLAVAAVDLAIGICPLFWLLLPLLLTSAYRQRRQPLVGTELGWSRGQWYLQIDDYRQVIELRRGHCLPWVTYLQWCDQAGQRGALWLFCDSAGRQSLRRLRVRLRLQRGI